MKHFFAPLIALMVGAGGASAAVTSAPFVGDMLENFESHSSTFSHKSSIFGGAVDVVQGSASLGVASQPGWSEFVSGNENSIIPQSGNNMGVLIFNGHITFDFTDLGGIYGFGGWVHSIFDPAPESLTFFDLAGVEMAHFAADQPLGADGVMEAFSFVSTTDAIGSIRFTGEETAFDDLYLTTTPLPAVPVPAGLPLMGGALALAAFVGRRRKS